MREPAEVTHIEPRWPVVLTILVVLALLTGLPARVKVFPIWIWFFAVIAVIGPMVALTLSTAKARWLRVERIVLPLFLATVGFATLDDLRYLLSEMVRGSTELKAYSSSLRVLRCGSAMCSFFR
jgi:hypothetical protein